MKRSSENPFHISISDLMTALFMAVMFMLIVMAASFRAEQEKVEVDSALQERLARDLTSELVRIGGDSTRMNPERLSIHWGDVWFNQNDYRLTQKGVRDIMNEAAPLVRYVLSDTWAPFINHVFILGHTDTIPRASDRHRPDMSSDVEMYFGNLELSQDRAAEVALRIDEQLSADFRDTYRRLISAVGRSFSEPARDPVTRNPYTGGRPENRRVELRFELCSMNEILAKSDSQQLIIKAKELTSKTSK